MINFDLLLLGWVTFAVSPSDISALSTRFLKRKFSVRINKDGSFTVPLRRVELARELLSGFEYTESSPRGLGGFLYNQRRRYGLICAVLLVIPVFIFLSSMVWDIRIDGAQEGTEEAIISDLEASGLGVGAFWRKINIGEVEARTLLSSDEISWLSINRRGTVAYVKVLGKSVHAPKEEPQGYANVIAGCDCIIESITVKRGVAMVEAGESVVKGQLLISGVLPSELGGGFCYAEGEVIGRYDAAATVTVEKTVNEKLYHDEKTGEIKLKIFGFTINILKMGGNSQIEYDIIEKKSDIELFGKGLPISTTVKYIKPYSVVERTRTASELVNEVSLQLKRRILEITGEADLLSVSTKADFTETGYCMTAALLCRGNVAKHLAFEAYTG